MEIRFNCPSVVVFVYVLSGRINAQIFEMNFYSEAVI